MISQMTRNTSIRLVALTYIMVLAFSCKKEDKPAPIDDDIVKNVESPLDTLDNGWELLSSKKFSAMIANSSQYFFRIRHIETHDNVADVFFEKHNAIIGTFNYSRWQVNLNSKTDVNFTNFDNFRWGAGILNFRSNSLSDNDFEYIKYDGYYKGTSSLVPLIPFQSYNSGTFINKYPVTSAFFGDDATVLSNGYIARVIGEQYDYYITKNFYYEDQLFTIPYKGKLIHCTFDNNINDNVIKISKSVDTLFSQSSPSFRQDSLHPFEVLKTYKHLLQPNTFVHQGVVTNIFKIGQYFHIYLSFRMDVTSGKRDIYHLKLDPENLSLTKEPSDYSAFYNTFGDQIYLNDRPGQILRHHVDLFNPTMTLFTGTAQQDIAMPKLKSLATRTDYYFYSKGRIYNVINYKDHLHLISKKI